MRDELIANLQALSLSGFSVSTDLPYTSSDEELYKKNVKRIYVNEQQSTNDAIIVLMNGCVINETVDSAEVIFSTDAKQKPSNYDSVVASIVATKENFMNEYHTRDYSVETEFDADLLITTIEFRFIKL